MAIVDSVFKSLRQAERELEGQLASVRAAMASLSGNGAARRHGRPAGTHQHELPIGLVNAGPTKRKRRKLSADARARISAAQKKRWAKYKSRVTR